MNTFGDFFKEYRLRASLYSLGQLAEAFAEKGYFYELSTYCRWQKGRRIPTKRNIILALIKLFIERGAITSTVEANEFLESAGHGYCTKKEVEQLFL